MSLPAGYSGVIMRTQHAHYGCGNVFRVAVYPGVPVLEMFVVKECQRATERERKREREKERGGTVKETGRDEEDLADKRNEDRGVSV